MNGAFTAWHRLKLSVSARIVKTSPAILVATNCISINAPVPYDKRVYGEKRAKNGPKFGLALDNASAWKN
jgi:hypothetical protein